MFGRLFMYLVYQELPSNQVTKSWPRGRQNSGSSVSPFLTNVLCQFGPSGRFSCWHLLCFLSVWERLCSSNAESESYVLEKFQPPLLEMLIRFSSQECSVPRRRWKSSLLPLDTALMQIIMTYNNSNKASGQKLTFCPPKSEWPEKTSLCCSLSVAYQVSVQGSVCIPLHFQYLKQSHSFMKTFCLKWFLMLSELKTPLNGFVISSGGNTNIC